MEREGTDSVEEIGAGRDCRKQVRFDDKCFEEASVDVDSMGDFGRGHKFLKQSCACSPPLVRDRPISDLTLDCATDINSAIYILVYITLWTTATTN